MPATSVLSDLLRRRRLWITFALLIAAAIYLARYREFTRFQTTTKPQRAAFFTAPWTGGGGDPVLMSYNDRTTEYVDGRAVYLDFNSKVLISKFIGRQSPSNTTGRIFVDADIHLVQKSAFIPTNPPSSRTSYYVVIDKLHRAHWCRG